MCNELTEWIVTPKPKHEDRFGARMHQAAIRRGRAYQPAPDKGGQSQPLRLHFVGAILDAVLPLLGLRHSRFVEKKP